LEERSGIGQLRRWIPKRKSIEDLTQKELAWVIKQYNQIQKNVLTGRLLKRYS
jgi:IS30 family transposase